jgi:hypothetical protein
VKTKAGRAKRKPGKKLSRFNLTRKGEIALVVVGVLVVAAAVFFLGALAYRGWTSRGPAARAEEERARAALEAQWSALQTDGTVLGTGRERETVLVDPDRWQKLLPTEKGPAAEVVRARFGWHYVFVVDARTGKKLGWYSRDTGYKAVPAGLE